MPLWIILDNDHTSRPRVKQIGRGATTPVAKANEEVFIVPADLEDQAMAALDQWPRNIPRWRKSHNRIEHEPNPNYVENRTDT